MCPSHTILVTLCPSIMEEEAAARASGQRLAGVGQLSRDFREGEKNDLPTGQLLPRTAS